MRFLVVVALAMVRRLALSPSLTVQASFAVAAPFEERNNSPHEPSCPRTQSRGEHCDPYNASCCKPGLICDTRHEHGSYKCLKRISKGCHEDHDCGHEQVCIHSNGSTYCGKHCALERWLASLTIRRAKSLAVRRPFVDSAKSVACIGPVLVDRARLERLKPRRKCEPSRPGATETRPRDRNDSFADSMIEHAGAMDSEG